MRVTLQPHGPRASRERLCGLIDRSIAGPKRRVSARALVLILVASFSSMAQQSPAPPAKDRGFSAVKSDSPIPTGRRIVVSIGIDQYANWQKLETATSDAREFSQLLIDRFGFQQIEVPLLDAAATRENILSLVEDRLRAKLKQDDDVVIFFAGHGTTRTDHVGSADVDTGYLVPVNAGAPGQNERWSDYIQTDVLLEAIGKLPARHILVILDACHSGFALGKAMKSFRGVPRYDASLANKFSRRVITSAGKDQLASDSGPVPNHSLFTGLLLQGLRWGKADIYGDGAVTSSELGLYMQRAVGAASAGGSDATPTQIPDFGSFDYDDRGELVLPLNDQTYDGIKASAFSALRWANYAEFRNLTAKVAELRPEAPETLYLLYRRAMLDKKVDDAADLIRRILALHIPEGEIPLSRDDLYNLKERLPYWKGVLLLPEKNFPLSLRLEAGPQLDRFAPVEKARLGDILAYPMKPGNPFQWLVTNNTDHPIYLYAMAIDQDGRVFPFSPWDPGPILTQGLAPHATHPTELFRQDGELELQEFHFFASPTQVYSLLSPVSTASRGLSRIDDNDLAPVTQAIERYTTMDLAAHAAAAKK